MNEVRVVLLKGQGKHFSAGIDLSMLQEFAMPGDGCEGRKREKFRQFILQLQNCFSMLEKCRKPIIASVHGSCLGAGLDLIAACDLRLCTHSASFSIKEIDLGITADVGSLQRLPAIIGDGTLRELAYTGKTISGEEAGQIKLVNYSYVDEETLNQQGVRLAQEIASKPPLAIRGIKEMILYGRDHTIQESLDYVATWNAAMLPSHDLLETFSAQREKRRPSFLD